MSFEFVPLTVSTLTAFRREFFRGEMVAKQGKISLKEIKRDREREKRKKRKGRKGKEKEKEERKEKQEEGRAAQWPTR